MTPLCDRCHDGAAKHMLPCTECGMRATTDWRLPGNKINDLQQQSIAELVKRSKAAHFVDVHVRINGKWEVYQVDWIKHLIAMSALKQEGVEATEGQDNPSSGCTPSSSPDPIREENGRAHRLIHAWCDSAPESPGCLYPECDCGADAEAQIE